MYSVSIVKPKECGSIVKVKCEGNRGGVKVKLETDIERQNTASDHIVNMGLDGAIINEFPLIHNQKAETLSRSQHESR